MDIAKLSISLNQMNLQQQASLMITKKAMVLAQQQGEGLKELLASSNVRAIQQAAQPHLGGSVDFSV